MKIPIDGNGMHGQASYEGKWIKLNKLEGNFPVTETSIEHTFCHELVHQILYLTEHNKLNKNEAFVDCFAGLLHQALTTMEYE